MASLISEEVCLQILQNYSPNSNDLKYVSSELKPLSDNIEGFAGEHGKLLIIYEERGVLKSQRFFVKSKPSKHKTLIELSENLGLYKKEIFAYGTLFKEFRKYGYDTTFASNLYYSIPDKTLVLDDVTLKGYSITERYENFTEGHLKCALNSLASFHAGGYALERTKAKELNRKFVLGEEYHEYLSEIFFVQYIDQSLSGMKWWPGFHKTLYAVIKLLPEDEAYKKDFRELVTKAELGKAFGINVTSKINKTCGHGDLWSNNLLFKYEKDVPVKCCLIDYQLVRYFYPSFDVLLAVFTNTSGEFRKLHLEDLYLYYHKLLSDNLKKYGYNVEEIHPLEDFYDSIKLVEVEAIVQYLLAICVTTLPKKYVDSLQNDDSGLNDMLFNNEKLVTEAFKNDTTYRNAVSDAVYELRNALGKRCQK